MQFPINPNNYSGGAVIFNSAPFLNLALQNEEKQRRKEAAIDSYLSEQSKALTPTGMRAKDIEGGWAAKAQKWQELGVKNKKYIANPALDGYKTINEFNRLKNELLADAETSKQEAKDEDWLANARRDGKWLSPTDDDEAIAQDKSRSIYDPNKKKRGLNELSVNRPPFDPSKFVAGVTAGKTKVENVDKYELNGKAGLRTNFVSQGYAPEEVKSMAENATVLMEQDKSAQIAFERMRKNPEKLIELQKAYETFYPGDVIDSDAKAAKAYTIMSVGGRTGFAKKVVAFTDKDAEEARSKRLIDYRANAQKRVNEAKAAATTKEAKSVLNGMMDDLWNEAQRNPIKISSSKNDGEKSYNIPLTEEVLKAGMLPGEEKTGGTPPSALRFVEKDGKKYVRRVVYQMEDVLDETKKYIVGRQPVRKDGKPILDNSKSTLIPYKQFRDKLGKELFAGKILYNELGQPVDSDNAIMDEADGPALRTERITREDLESIE